MKQSAMFYIEENKHWAILTHIENEITTYIYMILDTQRRHGNLIDVLTSTSDMDLSYAVLHLDEDCIAIIHLAKASKFTLVLH